MSTASQQQTNGPARSSTGIASGWFTERQALWPGQRFSLALEGFSDQSILYSGRSDFQSILVFKSAQYGNCLVLDGVIQLTERDEFAYQEMIVHVPLFSHACPKHVLIIGGGDGGVLREVCRHDCVESITMVEIDPTVIDVCKKYFANTTATSFDDPRLTIVHEDAAEFLHRQTENDNRCTGYEYDVIIADTSDPVGPAETLFQPEFYEQMSDALADGGIISAQGECYWIHLDLISDIIACCSDIFEYADYCTTGVPTYPCGQIGFILAGKGRATSCRTPRRHAAFIDKLRCYSRDIHRASFVLPSTVERRLAPFRTAVIEDKGRDYMYYDDDIHRRRMNDCCLSAACSIS
mmetsp:Transcript_15500/g.33725  ORF Transcript_15500/g.33725 Transcript_15500/m.33725 type:complete len:351 (-) Transcript_15500:75-1127(-)